LSIDELKLLVTGGAGFIGSNFIRHFLNEHKTCAIVNLDKLTYAGNLENLKDIEEGLRYRFVKGDIADAELVEQLFSEEAFDAVVNFAAESHVDRSIMDASPFIETNVKGTQILLDAARTHWAPDDDRKRYIQVSTDEVYGSLGETGTFTEDSTIAPNSPYAASKAAADLLCRSYHETYGLPVIIVRSSNNYGPYQFPEKLIPLIINNALKGAELPVYGKGRNVRDWLYVEDNCSAIARVVMEGEAGEIYNIGGGEERRNIEVVELICELLAPRIGKRPEELLALITYVKDRPGHDFRYSLDCSKIRRKLGWSREYEFDSGLERTIDWYLSHKDWVGRTLTGEYRDYYSKVYEHGWTG
jgi:dTDP-glucose 4,6-dehydratase